MKRRAGDLKSRDGSSTEKGGKREIKVREAGEQGTGGGRLSLFTVLFYLLVRLFVLSILKTTLTEGLRVQIKFYFSSIVKFFLFTVLSVCYFLCLSCPAILTSIVSASLAQWLEHWSCKPVVESSNLSRGCKGFFLVVPIDTQRIFQFIYTPIDWYTFHSLRSFINDC